MDTPSTTPAAITRLVLYCPDTPEHFALLMGALQKLTDEWYWQGAIADIETTVQWFTRANDLTSRKERALYVGQVVFTAGTVADTCLIPADGREVEIAIYPELYTVIGDVFGVATSGFFRVPNIGSRSIVGVGTNGTDTRILGDSGGANSVTIGVDNLPMHSHSVGTNLAGLALSPGELPVALPETTGTTGTTGAGEPIDITSPYLALIPYIVAR